MHVSYIENYSLVLTLLQNITRIYILKIRYLITYIHILNIINTKT